MKKGKDRAGNRWRPGGPRKPHAHAQAARPARAGWPDAASLSRSVPIRPGPAAPASGAGSAAEGTADAIAAQAGPEGRAALPEGPAAAAMEGSAAAPAGTAAAVPEGNAAAGGIGAPVAAGRAGAADAPPAAPARPAAQAGEGAAMPPAPGAREGAQEASSAEGPGPAAVAGDAQAAGGGMDAGAGKDAPAGAPQSPGAGAQEAQGHAAAEGAAGGGAQAPPSAGKEMPAAGKGGGGNAPGAKEGASGSAAPAGDASAGSASAGNPPSGDGAAEGPGGPAADAADTAPAPGHDPSIPHAEVKIRLLHSEEEIAEADAMNRARGLIEVCSDARGRKWGDIWRTHQNSMKAGIGADSVLAIDGLVTCTLSCRVQPLDLAVFTRRFLQGEFGEMNVLSCIGGKHRTTFCHFLIYPLNIRQLNPARWVDARTGQLKRKLSNDFIDGIAGNFGINLTDSLETVGNGHTQYLDDKPMVVTTKGDVEEMFYDTLTEDSQIQTDFPRDKMEEISASAITYFTIGVAKSSFMKLNMGELSPKEYLGEVEAHLRQMYPDMTKRDVKFIVERVRSAALGFYVLDPLINDPRISDIKVVSPDRIRVKVNGKRRTSNLRFIDWEDYDRFLNGILTRYHRDPYDPIHVFTDKTTNENYILRNNITLEDINSGFPVYHIRKVNKKKYSIEELIELGVMDRTVANYLIWAAREAKGLVFTGKGSSGKTTMMNTLLEYTPSDASGLVIQESEELFSSKPEMTFEHIAKAKNGREYDLKELSRNGLLTDIDYFIIGEVKGDEAMYFINACDTGNKGWCSVHSPSSRDAIAKLADYVMYASKYDRDDAMQMLKELQVVVFMKNFRVAEISEVTGWDPVKKDLEYRLVFRRADLMNGQQE